MSAVSVIGSSPPRLVPWISWQEWDEVRTWLLGEDKLNIQRGLDRVTAWQARGRLPVAVEVTAELRYTQQRDPSSLLCGASWLPEEMLRMAYSMFIVRLINGVADPAQKGKFALSITDLACAAGLPRLLVDIRHEASHNEMPALPILRLAAAQALTWLQQNYWGAQQAALAQSQLALRQKVLEYARLLGGGGSIGGLQGEDVEDRGSPLGDVQMLGGALDDEGGEEDKEGEEEQEERTVAEKMKGLERKRKRNAAKLAVKRMKAALQRDLTQAACSPACADLVALLLEEGLRSHLTAPSVPAQGDLPRVSGRPEASSALQGDDGGGARGPGLRTLAKQAPAGAGGWGSESALEGGAGPTGGAEGEGGAWEPVTPEALRASISSLLPHARHLAPSLFRGIVERLQAAAAAAARLEAEEQGAGAGAAGHRDVESQLSDWGLWLLEEADAAAAVESTGGHDGLPCSLPPPPDSRPRKRVKRPCGGGEGKEQSVVEGATPLLSQELLSEALVACLKSAPSAFTSPPPQLPAPGPPSACSTEREGQDSSTAVVALAVALVRRIRGEKRLQLELLALLQGGDAIAAPAADAGIPAPAADAKVSPSLGKEGAAADGRLLEEQGGPSELDMEPDVEPDMEPEAQPVPKKSVPLRDVVRELDKMMAGVQEQEQERKLEQEKEPETEQEQELELDVSFPVVARTGPWGGEPADVETPSLGRTSWASRVPGAATRGAHPPDGSGSGAAHGTERGGAHAAAAGAGGPGQVSASGSGSIGPRRLGYGAAGEDGDRWRSGLESPVHGLVTRARARFTRPPSGAEASPGAGDLGGLPREGAAEKEEEEEQEVETATDNCGLWRLADNWRPCALGLLPSPHHPQGLLPCLVQPAAVAGGEQARWPPGEHPDGGHVWAGECGRPAPPDDNQGGVHPASASLPSREALEGCAGWGMPSAGPARQATGGEQQASGQVGERVECPQCGTPFPRAGENADGNRRGMTAAAAAAGGDTPLLTAEALEGEHANVGEEDESERAEAERERRLVGLSWWHAQSSARPGDAAQRGRGAAAEEEEEEEEAVEARQAAKEANEEEERLAGATMLGSEERQREREGGGAVLGYLMREHTLVPCTQEDILTLQKAIRVL